MGEAGIAVPPWVEVEREYVPVKEGQAEVNITCRYKGNPEPKVDWIRNGYRIQVPSHSAIAFLKTAQRHGQLRMGD